MTRLRVLLLLASGALAVAAGAAGVRLSHPERPAARAAPSAAAATVQPVVVPSSARAAPPGPDLRDVPAGIISRAASARALERAPVCGQPGRRDDPGCAPRRDTVEVQWDVGKAP